MVRALQPLGAVLAWVALLGCQPPTECPAPVCDDAGTLDGGARDAGAHDAGAFDGGLPDGGDGGSDGGALDAGTRPDAGFLRVFVTRERFTGELWVGPVDADARCARTAAAARLPGTWLAFDERGRQVAFYGHWSGTYPLWMPETALYTCDDWTSNTASGDFGIPGFVDDRWTYEGNTFCVNGRRLLCFER